MVCFFEMEGTFRRPYIGFDYLFSMSDHPPSFKGPLREVTFLGHAAHVHCFSGPQFHAQRGLASLTERPSLVFVRWASKKKVKTGREIRSWTRHLPCCCCCCCCAVKLGESFISASLRETNYRRRERRSAVWGWISGLLVQAR